MKRPLYLFIVLTTLAALLLSACSTSNTNEPLVVPIETDEGTLTPLGYRTATGFWMTGWVYDTLYARDLEAGTLTTAAGETHPLQPLGDAKDVIDAGGLFAFARKSGMIR